MLFEANTQGANVWSNEAWVRYTGLPRAELAGNGWQRVLHPDDMSKDYADWVRAVEGAGEYRMRQRIRRHDGQWRWNLVQAAPLRNAAGGIEGWAGTVTDIDDIVRGEASLHEQARLARFELELDLGLRDVAEAQAMVDLATAALGRHLGVAQAGYGEIDEAQEHVTVYRDWNDGRIPSVAGTWRMTDFGPAFIEDLKAGRTVVIPDITQDPRTHAPAVVAAYEGIRTRSILDLALVKQGRMVAMLFIHHPEPRHWTPTEVLLVEKTCERLWTAVERARAERALAASEAHLRAVLDALPVGVGMADAQGRLVRHNRANLELWGMLPETNGCEQYGQWEGYWGDSGQRIAAEDWALARALRQGEIVRGELVEYQPFGGGPRRWGINNAAPVRDAQGHIVGGVAVTLDVTPLRAAQAALAERERILSLFVENAPAAIAMFDTNMRYLAASRRFLADYGIPSDTEVLGRSHYEVCPGQPAHWLLLHTRALQGEDVAQERDAFVGADGRQGWVRWAMCPWRDGEGRIAGALLTAEVITAQVQAEKQLEQALLLSRQSETQAQQAAQQLAQAQLRLDVALAGGRLGVWDWDLATGKSYWTRQMFELLALPGREDGAARADLFMSLVHPEDRAGVENAVAQALDGQATFDKEMRLVRADGTTCWVLGRALVLRDERGRAQRMVGMNLDITAQKAAQARVAELNATLEQQVLQRTAELAAARDAAEAANRAKSAFLANMSHEIRTPLNAILGLAHLLGQDNLPPRQAQQLAEIEGAGQHLLSTINDILDLSRIEAGRLQLEARDFELVSLLEQVRSIVGASAAAKGLALEVDIGDVPARLSGDDTRVRQALLNYAGNAVKFTETGRIMLRARLQTRRATTLLVRFEVEDTGLGLEPQQVSRLFEPFEQADASTTREHGGSGLGLAITRRLAELMGGSAGARPRPGGGSIFWFTAWLGQGTAATAPREATPLRADAALRQRHAGARVLVAEDNPVNREVALALLRAVALDVDFAEDGAIAVKKVGQDHYDLVLMDMQMPVMDGLQAARTLRGMPNLEGLPILAMTANAFDDDRAACLDAGMNDFVTKPVQPPVLYATLLAWLDRGPPQNARPVRPAPEAPSDTGLS